MLFFDFEVFKYDWLVVAIDPVTTTKHIVINDKKGLEKLYKQYKDDIWVGFNCRNYDQYILKGILCGFDPKEINDWIIVKDRKGWEFSSMFNKIPLILFDAMPNPPVSLKTLEGFLGKNIHETSVPFDIDRKLTVQEINETVDYCTDDVLNCIDVFLQRKSEFDAQMDLLKAFNLPLSYLGKTQAQLAAVILDAKKIRFKDDWNIRVPDNAILGKYQAVADWFLNPENHNEDASCTMMIAGLEHTIAWGGIHAGIPKTTITCDEDEEMFDADVGQLYPNIMVIYNLISRAARNPGMLKYILDTSMRLKAEGKTKEREPYKRQCNIVYGAMGDAFNPLYDPLHRKLVCVYGQIFLVDLIDKIEDIVYLINSNTDGIFYKVKKKDIPELNRRIAEWEQRTGLIMDYKSFTRFVSKDVNNYLAIQTNGKIHAKGAYVKDLNPLDYDLPIVNEALRNYMIYGIRVEDTIFACDKLIKFQKIVKLSSKYKWVEHEQGYSPRYSPRGLVIDDYKSTIKYDNKAYRVFASRDENDGKLLKCDGVRNPAKFGLTPEHCFVFNDDLKGVPIPKKLDRSYYIELARKRLEDFGL